MRLAVRSAYRRTVVLPIQSMPMRLLLVFDHRFQRRADGVVFSAKNYGYGFFAKRYLRVFDGVTILARVAASAADGAHDAEPTEGPGVEVASLGDWQGLSGLLRAWRPLRAELHRHLAVSEAVLLVAPGMLAPLARRWLLDDGRS